MACIPGLHHLKTHLYKRNYTATLLVDTTAYPLEHTLSIKTQVQHVVGAFFTSILTKQTLGMCVSRAGRNGSFTPLISARPVWSAPQTVPMLLVMGTDLLCVLLVFVETHYGAQ